MPPRPPRVLRRLWRSLQELVRVVMQKLKRLFIILLPINKNSQLKKGFVLPTATLVLLVVSLLVGALIVRTGQEAEQAISQQAQQEIYNAATPAIERAKAKIEFLFRKDNRFPAGIPSEEFLNSMMLNNGGIDSDGDAIDIQITAQDPDRYTLSDEDRLTIANDSSAENAWRYRTDTDGDGVDDSTVSYSITILSETDDGSGTTVNINNSESDKANNLVVRSGPVSAGATSDAQTCEDLASLDASEGWYTVTGSTVRKNFQINAVVTNDNEANKAVSTLEVQQDRDLSTGNKWGAWFRYDLEFTPGSNFNWNGAMFTAGSLLVNNSGTKTTRLRLVSSPSSCLYTKQASQITMAEEEDPDTGQTTFQGQVMRVDTDRDEWERNDDDRVLVDLFPGPNQRPQNTGSNPPYETFELPMHDDNPNSGGPEDSVIDSDVVRPSQYMLDPVLLISENTSQARYEDDPTNTAVRNEDWEDNPLSTRIFNQNANQPFVDDTYRADNRWGPKPQYNNNPDYQVTAANNGTEITGQEGLTKMPTIADPNVAGLDGYWERRANVEGMRIIVGESFQLGLPPGASPSNEVTNAKIAYIEFENHTLPSGNDKINFQPSGFSTPSGFKADTGEAYGDRGGGDKYGWLDSDGNPSANGETRDRGGSPPEKVTLNHMDLGDSNLQWQVEVPNGTYELKIVMGDDDYTNQDNSIALEPFVPPGDTPPAVQAGAVYHWDGYQDEPATCIALAGHPGVSESTQFDNVTVGGTDYLETDFLNRKGSNGWEFPFYANFSTEIDNSTSILRQSLSNLAHYAGDPDGAFPPTQDDGSNSDAVTHPYPQLTKSGNFSNLRRAISELDATGTNYADLSLADQTTLQTATCTLGMLAYNVDLVERVYDAIPDNGGAGLNALGVQISQLIDGDITNGEMGGDPDNLCESGDSFGDDGCPPEDPYSVTDPTSPNHFSNYYTQFTSQEWINVIEANNLLGADTAQATERAEQITRFRQIERDRTLGFAEGIGVPNSGGSSDYDADNTQFAIGFDDGNFVSGQTFNGIECDPTTYATSGGNSARAQFGLAVGFCSAGQPKYPWLFYLFPVIDHDHNGDSSDGNEQPTSEPYISDTYIFDDSMAGTPGGVNGDYTYQAISATDIASLALTPRDADSFVLPTTTSDTGTGNRIFKPDGNPLFVPFMDKAIYDDREKMDVRLLDIDLDLLRSNTTGNTNDDYWLPTSSSDRDAGVVYAFREDAVREDAIARPFNNDWATCGNESMLTGLDLTTGNVLSNLSTSDTCRMQPSIPQDPPLNDETGVSAKPVDGYADPDRRPYGFRLKNGSDLSRSNSDSTGLSFITDQPVYIQGDFNKHTQEEFTDTSSSFYDRSTLNTNFATAAGETWRSSEIIADGITLLSEGLTDQATTDQVSPSPSDDIEVNSILVSAIIPSQPKKYNGGIHNFPRFLEDWEGTGGTVKIRGSFIQLNFSKYATGSFDQDNLDSESPQNLSAGANLPHYSPPTRNWGYDVGLQYVSAAPVAERFVSSESPRTETYRELPADDPYIQNLLDGTVVSTP
ncbi:hormogonium polysaccharide biosynthesis protein HpsA [Dactylococcopsis salina]|uniref:Uncharacterized protein n=1 Tax=Dactylococcopsis salina (strain PCC 8305) TaxID=13035 RepID=K9YZ81_DACS8|nr:hormogonium polysaccharide biosynthesis protein HpsA [Dactylococcopsis salina]AFZ51635.1 hypothetical protein Dacsa_3106 [Dactylococcopsis salina PCC 8305]